MVCHICSAPASASCYECHRYMCNGHTRGAVSDGSRSYPLCATCYVEPNSCVFCGARGRHGYLRKCFICNRSFCEDHDSPPYYPHRCKDHGLTGWEKFKAEWFHN